MTYLTRERIEERLQEGNMPIRDMLSISRGEMAALCKLALKGLAADGLVKGLDKAEKYLRLCGHRLQGDSAYDAVVESLAKYKQECGT